MHLSAVRESVGCLLIGETIRMRALSERLNACGVDTVFAPHGGNLRSAVQEGLYKARKPGGVCVAAEGEMWSAALALAAQLSVERVALIAPTDRFRNAKDGWEKQLVRLKEFARSNLFFCVSDVLVLEGGDEWPAGRMDALFRRMCNARVQRVALSDQKWTNCEHSQVDAAARFLKDGEFVFSLAK